ncbi:MAG: TIGR00269 family protein [Candidatus Thermoplasmatota archaeon]
MLCSKCDSTAATLIRYSGQHLCRDHFIAFLERRVRHELRQQVDLRGGERIAIGLSGGKDSSVATVLLHDILSPRTDIELVAITVDEGIASYRPEGVVFATSLCQSLGIEHQVARIEDTVGRTMDEIVAMDPLTIPCSYCGVFRRQALNRAAKEVGADHLATGLNLDDTAQSILMNIARGDVEKLARLGPHEHVQPGLVPRLQPLRLIPEKEVYLYAMLRGIHFHDATCPNAERAHRGKFREILNRLEADAPGTRHAIVRGYDRMRPFLVEAFGSVLLQPCTVCGEPTANTVCNACELKTLLGPLEDADERVVGNERLTR